MNDWKYIDDYKELPKEANFIHCDTRDFFILCLIEQNNEIIKEFHDQLGYGTLSDFKIKYEEILPILKNLETQSGGRKDWRMLHIESCKPWLKYIRFLKTNEDCYIAYTNSGDYHTFLSKTMLKCGI